MTLLALVVWGGALICLEDQLPTLAPHPSTIGLAAGSILLLFSLWRGIATLHMDTVVYALPLLQGLGLALLCAPPRALRRFRDPLLVLALFPLQLALMRALPEQTISEVTARLTQGLFLLLGQDVAVQGRVVALGTGSVRISQACNGIDLIAQLAAIGVIFALAFPLQRRALRLGLVVLAPLIALLSNAIRIALLAGITTSAWPQRQLLFLFFHDEWGALVFSGLAMGAFGWLYLLVLERELQSRGIGG